MQAFEYANPTTLKEATALLGASWADAAVLAGELAEGIEVVTAIQAAATPNASSSSSPLLPSRRPPENRGPRGPSTP